MIAGGTFAVPAAHGIFDSGFHHAVPIVRTLPRQEARLRGRRVVLTLRDASRPRVICESDDPRDGCATVDFADVPDRPHTPITGVFRNVVTLRLATGRRARLFLRRDGSLQPRPEPYDASLPHAAIGGGARSWIGVLQAPVLAGSRVRLHLVLTKLGRPAVRIRWTLAVLP